MTRAVPYGQANMKAVAIFSNLSSKKDKLYQVCQCDPVACRGYQPSPGRLHHQQIPIPRQNSWGKPDVADHQVDISQKASSTSGRPNPNWMRIWIQQFGQVRDILLAQDRDPHRWFPGRKYGFWLSPKTSFFKLWSRLQMFWRSAGHWCLAASILNPATPMSMRLLKKSTCFVGRIRILD